MKRLRTQAKINKKKFALMVGIGRPFLDKIEDGSADPRLAVIVKLAEALDTTPRALLTKHDAGKAHAGPLPHAKRLRIS